LEDVIKLEKKQKR